MFHCENVQWYMYNGNLRFDVVSCKNNAAVGERRISPLSPSLWAWGPSCPSVLWDSLPIQLACLATCQARADLLDQKPLNNSSTLVKSHKLPATFRLDRHKVLCTDKSIHVETWHFSISEIHHLWSFCQFSLLKREASAFYTRFFFCTCLKTVHILNVRIATGGRHPHTPIIFTDCKLDCELSWCLGCKGGGKPCTGGTPGSSCFVLPAQEMRSHMTQSFCGSPELDLYFYERRY